MISVTGKHFKTIDDSIRSAARRAPVQVTHRSRPELVVLSVEEYALLRQNRKPVVKHIDMSAAKIQRIAKARMDAEHAELDALMVD
jgi:prevent-host-death family protein